MEQLRVLLNYLIPINYIRRTKLIIKDSELVSVIYCTTFVIYLLHIQNTIKIFFYFLKTLRFASYAFNAYKTNITSCARPALFQNVFLDSDSRIYGPIDSERFDEIGIFSIVDHVSHIFTALYSNIVLDNIQIAVTENASSPIMF